MVTLAEGQISPTPFRTAQKYMATHRLAGEIRPGGAICPDLSANALYALVQYDNAGAKKAVKAALREAKTKWVGEERVLEIYFALIAAALTRCPIRRRRRPSRMAKSPTLSRLAKRL